MSATKTTRISHLAIAAMKYSRGDQGFGIDNSIDDADLLREMTRRAIDAFRGLRHVHRVRGRAPIFVERSVSIRSPQKVSLGRGVSIGRGTLINARGGDHISIGDNVTLGAFSTIVTTGVLRAAGGSLDIHPNVGLGPYTYLGAQGDLVIEEATIAGPRLMVFTEDHDFRNPDAPVRNQGESRSPVRIESGCWLGAGVTVLRGVTIGAGSVVAAGSVVRENVPPRTLVVGAPAKAVRSL